LWNVAGDLFINDQAREHGFTLPKGGLYPETFSYPRNLSADEYYALLVKDGEDKVGEGADGAQAGEGSWKSGKCGSGAGNPIDGEPTTDTEIGEAGGRTESEIGTAIQRTAEAVKQHAHGHGRGNLPCGLDRWADEVTAPAKVPWQTVLSRTIRRAVTYRAGAVDYSYQRISRRQGGIGYGVGAPILPAYVKPIPRVAFVLDTSGSMSGSQLEAGLAEAIGVLKATGAEITFMSCDYAVHAVGKVSKASDLVKLVKGGGGSSFVPAFEHLAKLRERPQVAIFATDGDISVPLQAPGGMQVIWLLVGASRAPTTAYGNVIEVD
jgi:predicted metal-dependent peptidase